MASSSSCIAHCDSLYGLFFGAARNLDCGLKPLVSQFEKNRKRRQHTITLIRPAYPHKDNKNMFGFGGNSTVQPPAGPSSAEDTTKADHSPIPSSSASSFFAPASSSTFSQNNGAHTAAGMLTGITFDPRTFAPTIGSNHKDVEYLQLDTTNPLSAIQQSANQRRGWSERMCLNVGSFYSAGNHDFVIENKRTRYSSRWKQVWRWVARMAFLKDYVHL